MSAFLLPVRNVPIVFTVVVGYGTYPSATETGALSQTGTNVIWPLPTK